MTAGELAVVCADLTHAVELMNGQVLNIQRCLQELEAVGSKAEDEDPVCREYCAFFQVRAMIVCGSSLDRCGCAAVVAQ